MESTSQHSSSPTSAQGHDAEKLAAEVENFGDRDLRLSMENLPLQAAGGMDIPAVRESDKVGSGTLDDDIAKWISSRTQAEFKILDRIGVGAFGAVFKVRSNISKQCYAIKCIRFDPSKKDLVKKIIREVELLSQLKHVNVVRYHQSWTKSTGEPKSENPSEDDQEDDDDGTSEESESEQDEVSNSNTYRDEDTETGNSTANSTSDSSEQSKLTDCLYILTEFCEQKSLREAIELELYKDVSRVWQLFREIIEGLVYIHGKGIIHRDLKPDNIFLDSNGYVKIGDFGLATTYIIDAHENDVNALESRSNNPGGGGDESTQTKYIGTPLYVSPEIMNSTTKYDQKVDLYSLGVIFFEMCYRPIVGMERQKVFDNLRGDTITFPEDFNGLKMKNQLLSNQGTVIRWLLKKNPSDRPTSKELLESSFLPRLALTHGDVVISLEKLFLKNGAIHISTPLLMPMSSLLRGLVVLPHDHKVPFAHYIACCASGVTQLRRYSVENVYCENRLTKCLFDIVSPPACTSLIPDAEVIAIVSEVISEMRGHYDTRDYEIRINHTALVKAVLLHCGIEEMYHAKVCAILDRKEGFPYTLALTRPYIHKLLRDLPFTGKCVSMLCNFLLPKEIRFKQISKNKYWRRLRKTEGEAGSLARTALRELKDIRKKVKALGCKFQPVLAIGLLSNIQHYSGVIFQVFSKEERTNGGWVGVIATGGRYDPLITLFKNRSTISEKPKHQKVVGVSIAFDKIVRIKIESANSSNPALDRALICSLGDDLLEEEKLSAAEKLRSIGVSSDIYLSSTNPPQFDEIIHYCQTNYFTHLVGLKNKEQMSVFKTQPREEVFSGSLEELMEFFKNSLLKKGQKFQYLQTTTNK